MVQESLYFIQPHIIERLTSGKFVARRQQTKAYRIRDRRNALSPLNVTRRAIRYEPLVYLNRKEELLEAVETLNLPEKKLLLVHGPTGRGKTSFLRMIVELMGGGKEQLLWFDVSRHTDFDEVIRFLVESMTELCRSMESTGESAPTNANPVATLEGLLRQAGDFPILIIIDNMEHLVTPDRTIRSRELKDAFNFLLSFPNVKLILSGKHLPYSDMNPSARAVHNMDLAPLDAEKSEGLVKELFHNPNLKGHELAPLMPFFQGEPYLLFLFAVLFERHPDFSTWYHELQHASNNAKQVLINYLYQHLSPTEQRVTAILSLIRHSMTLSGLQALIQHCEPELDDFDFRQMDQSFVRLVLKKVYPPQMVLDKLRNRERQQSEETDAIEAYYQLNELFQGLIIQRIPEEEQIHYHNLLQQFYLIEKNKHVLDRVYKARTRHLAAEAQHHFSRIKKRRRATLMADPFLSETTEPKADLPPTEIYRYGPYTGPAGDPIRPMGSHRPAAATAETPSDSQTLPWPPMAEGDEVADEEEALYLHPDAPHRAVPDVRVAPVQPISIQLEPNIYASSPTVKLSEEDLEKLAQLITQPNYRPAPMPSPMANPLPTHHPHEETFADEDESPEEATSAEPPPVEEDDPREQEIQARLNVAMAAHNRPGIARELLHLGQHRLRKGLHQNAESCLLQALSYAEEAKVVPLQLKINAVLGHHYKEHFQHNRALQHLRTVELLFDHSKKSDKEKNVLSHILRDMAEIHVFRKNTAEAVSLFQKALELRPGNSAFKADVLFKLGLALDEAERFDEAIETYRQSFEMSEALGDSRACAASLYNLASLYYEQSQFQKAQETMARCLVYDKQNGSDKEIFHSLMLLSRIYEARHAYDQARQSAHEAYQTAQAMADPADLASVLLRLGDLAEGQGQLQQAAGYYRQAQAVASDELSQDSRHLILQKLQSIEEHLT